MELMRQWAWTLGLAGVLALIGGGALAWAFGGIEGTPQVLLFAGAALLMAYAALDRDNVSDAVQSRSFIHGGSSAILVGLAAVAAIATYSLAKKYDTTWDLTREHSFTLSDHTTGILEGLDADVEVLAFFSGDSQDQKNFRGLIDRMAEHTDKLHIRWIDPLRQPRLAEDNDVASEHGTVILEGSEGKSQRLDAEFTEEAVIKKLVLLQSETEHRICWALGHGEPDPDDEFAERGLGVAVIQLEELNYQVTRSMIPTDGIDPACEALVIARPELTWMPWEREALAAYLGGGGRVLAMIEPNGSPDLAEELGRFGIKLRADVVLDVNPENQMMGVDDPSFVVLHGRNLLSHPITANLAAAVVLPIARSVEPDGEAAGITAQAVLQTSQDAWGEMGGDPNAMPQANPGVELVGEVPVMAVAVIDDPAALNVLPHDADEGRAVPEGWTPTAGGRLVVIGDADFAANGYIQLGNNRDLILNTIAWLVEEEDQIGERPEAGQTLAMDELSGSFLCLVTLVFVPGGVGLLALLMWARRRRL